MEKIDSVKKIYPKYPFGLGVIVLGSISTVIGVGLSILVLEYLVRTFDLGSEIVYQPNRLYGWSHTPGDRFRWKIDNSSINISINSLGLRDYEYSYEKPKGVFRILVLGDSFSEAFQVYLEQSFAKQIESFLNNLAFKKYSKIQVINAGVSGFGTDNELLFYESEGFKYQPDVVLVAFCICNDVRNNWHELEKLSAGGERKPYFIPGEKGLVLENYPFDRIESKISKIKFFLNRNVRSYTFLREVLNRVKYQERVKEIGMPLDLHLYGEKYSEEWQKAWFVTKGILKQFKSEANQNGAHFLVALIPTQYQVHSHFWNTARETYPKMQSGIWNIVKPNKILRGFFNEEKISYVDLLPKFLERARSSQEDLYFVSDGHWNKEGHQLAGRLIAEKILSLGLLEKRN